MRRRDDYASWRVFDKEGERVAAVMFGVGANKLADLTPVAPSSITVRNFRLAPSARTLGETISRGGRSSGFFGDRFVASANAAPQYLLSGLGC